MRRHFSSTVYVLGKRSKATTTLYGLLVEKGPGMACFNSLLSARLTEEHGMSTQDAARAVVIVTGAGKGIGAASARWLAREGWRVVAAAKDGAAAARVAAEVHGLAAKAEVGVAAAV